MKKSGLAGILCFFLVVFCCVTFAFAAVGNQNPYSNPENNLHVYNNSRDLSKKYKDDEILVKFKEGVFESKKNNIHNKNGSAKIKEFKSLRIHHLKLKKGVRVEDAVKSYKSEPDVEYAEPNYLFRAQVIPDDPKYSELWGMAKISAPTAWDLTTGNNSVVVAVIDTGVDYSHPDLAGNIWVNAAEIAGNNIDDDGNGYVDDIYGINAVSGGNPMDDNGHGTHVSGTIGAIGNNGIGVAGLNWEIKIVACKFLDSSGSGSTAGAIECLQYIKTLKDRGLNVVATNNSWGGDGYSQALYDAINAQGDLLFIAAAGNNSTDNDKISFYPATYNLPNLLAVAATDANDNLASFSNYGAQSVHVGAPGHNIVSTLPANSYGSLSGTSMATPHVTGLAALLKSQDMNRNGKAIKNLLLSSGDVITSLEQTTITGKRINAINSIACFDTPVFSVLKHPSTITVGVPVTLSVLSINCALSTGPVAVTATGGEAVTVADDGLLPDLAANDGIFTGTWIPSQAAEALTFSSPGGERVIEFPPLNITTMILPEGSIDSPYSSQLTADGGIAPFNWTIISGSLPPGLVLDSFGTISGSPTTNGYYTFIVEVADGIGAKLQKNLSLSVVNHFLVQSWVKESLTTSNQFGTPEGDVAVDAFGNISVTGNYYAFWHMPARAWVTKYDSAGNPLWHRDDVGGVISGANKALDAIATDGDGNVYGVGYVNDKITDTAPPDSWLTVKYDPSGNLLWDRSFMPGIDGAATAVAVDGAGNVYVTGYGGRGVNSYTGVNEAFIVTAKYDTSGTLQWTKTYGEDNSKLGYGIAVDDSGNVYVTGHEYIIDGGSSTQDIIVIKYDAAGNLLWSKQYIPPAGHGYSGKSIAVDNAGNVYIGGQGNRYSSSDYFHLTLKYDPAGNFQWAKQYPLPYASTNGIAVDQHNDVYVTGDYFANGDPGGIRLISTIKYDASGNLVGAKEFYNVAYRKTWSRGIAVDNDDNLAIVGFSNNDDVNVDFFTLKYTQLPLFPLQLTILGSGSGTVNIVPGTACTTNCTQYYKDGIQVTLTAAPNTSSIFSGWGGVCAGTGSCTVTMNGITSASATFTLNDLTPPVTTASPPGGNYVTPQAVTLTANEPATIYYTINGSTPTTSSPIYSSPIIISAANTTLKFFARDVAGNTENVRTETYSVENFFNLKTPVNYITGYYPVAVATGDFNGDGKSDLASANQNANTVSVLLGIGDGKFQPKMDFGVGTRPNGVAIADFDGDGNVDLAVVNIDMNNVSILKGNGNGTFAPRIDFAVGNGPSSVVTGDFNADGRVDLAVSYYSLDVVSILLGNGDGTFQNRVDYGVGIKPQSLATGDFNSDGRMDLVAGNYNSNSVSILTGNGNGTFLPKTDFAAGTNPSWVTTGDFNGDLKLDLAVTNWTSNSVSILLGNGDCTFQPMASYGVGKWPQTSIAKDFNNDSHIDLMVVNTSGTSNNVSILLGKGDGTFLGRNDFNAVSYSRGAASGDFNGDGQYDLAVTNPAQNNISILLNDSGSVIIPLAADLTVSPASSQFKGTSVTFTATASGGSGNYEYQFWYRAAGAPGYTMARAYNSTPTFIWDTNSVTVGNYEWVVYARNAGSTAPYEAMSQVVPYMINPAPVSAVALSSSPLSPQFLGTDITFTATASGGSGSYEYQFWYRDTWSANFILARDYGSGNLFIWETAAVEVANYEWKVYARNTGSTAPFEAISLNLPYTINAVPPVASVVLAASPSSPQVQGTLVAFTGTASGGSGTYEYQFWYRPAGSPAFTMAQDYTSSSLFIWDTAFASPGSYEWKVFARNAGSTVSAGSEILTYTLSPPPASAVSLSASPLSPQFQGTSVTYTGTASGGNGSYEYQFWYRAVGSASYAMVQDYSTSTSYVWDTTVIAAGNYEWMVYARNAGSTATFEATSQVMTYTLSTPISNPPVTTVTISSTPTSPQQIGTTVTFTGRARGGVSPYQYRFVIRDSGGNTLVNTSYGAANKFVWNTNGLAAGTYTAEVRARSAGNIGDNEASSSISYQLTAPPVTSVTLSATPTSPQLRGVAVVFSGQAAGGVAPYQYQFIVKNSKGKTVASSGYSTSGTWTWSTTSALAAGTYTVEVDARSAGSTASREAYMTASYVLN